MLGTGAFGMVMRGDAQGIRGSSGSVKVAVKVAKGTTFFCFLNMMVNSSNVKPDQNFSNLFTLIYHGPPNKGKAIQQRYAPGPQIAAVGLQ